MRERDGRLFPQRPVRDQLDVHAVVLPLDGIDELYHLDFGFAKHVPLSVQEANYSWRISRLARHHAAESRASEHNDAVAAARALESTIFRLSVAGGRTCQCEYRKQEEECEWQEPGSRG